MKLPDDATIRHDRLEEHLSTGKLANKYHTDKRAVVKRLRKMGLPSNQYQNWGRGYRVWRGMGRQEKLENEEQEDARRESIRKTILQLHPCLVCGKQTISRTSCFRHRPSLGSSTPPTDCV